MAQAAAEIAEQRKALGIVSVAATATKPTQADDAEAETDAAVANASEENSAQGNPANGGQPFDDDAPVWPTDAAEAAFLTEEKNLGHQAPRTAPQTLRQEAAESEAALGPLPSIDALIARLPVTARETLEDLFRPKFTGVKRVSPDVLK